jgi:hypothetical protein
MSVGDIVADCVAPTGRHAVTGLVRGVVDTRAASAARTPCRHDA